MCDILSVFIVNVFLGANKYILLLLIVFQEFSKDSYLQPISEHDGHQLTGEVVTLAPHHKWLASCSTDGSLAVRAVGALVCLALYSLMMPGDITQRMMP